MLSDKERAALIAAGTEEAYRKLEQVDAVALLELERLYRTVLALMTERLWQYGSDGYFAERYYRQMMAYVGQVLDAMGMERQRLLDESLREAAAAGAYPAQLAGVDNTALNLAVTHSAKAVYDLEFADGLQLSERIWKLNRGATTAIGKALRAAIAEGRNPMAAGREFLRTDHLDGIFGESLLTGTNNALYNAQRVFQTEMKRAHGISYVSSNKDIPGLIGYKFRLSPLHRKTDICDQHAAADLYGLGAGVYPPDKILKIFPAHPNTRSFIVAVFRD